MKVDFKKIACFGLVALFGGLSAQEAPTEESREIAMSCCPGECKRAPEDCCRGTQGMTERQPRRDRYDYDVYTTGPASENTSEDKCCGCPPAPKPKCQERPKKKTNCGDCCNRRGAAKSAQD